MFFKKSVLTKAPSDDSFPIVEALFYSRNHQLSTHSLSLTILELIKEDVIIVDVGENDDLMVALSFRITNRKTDSLSQKLALDILKSISNSKKFTLKDLYKKIKNPVIAKKFGQLFLKFQKALASENNYSSNYKNILQDKKLTNEGKNLKKDWKAFKNYLTSDAGINDENIMYSACFGVCKNITKNKTSDTQLFEFVKHDGYELLNKIFSEAISNIKTKKGDGLFWDINDKYTIPGGG